MKDDSISNGTESHRHESQLGHNPEGGTLVVEASHRGHVLSWVSVLLAVAGFTVGGVGLTIGVNLALIAIGIVLIVASGVLGLVSDIFADVVLDSPRVLPELAHTTRRGRPRMRTTGSRNALPQFPDDADRPRLL